MKPVLMRVRALRLMFVVWPTVPGVVTVVALPV
jgi:hypothetical protein